MKISYPSIIPKLLIGFLYFGLLVSCTTNQTQETPTPGITTLTITSTITKVRASTTYTPTQNPVPSNTLPVTQTSTIKEVHFPEPSSTYTPRPTYTIGPTSTSKHAETPLPLPTLPVLPELQPSITYQLTTPAPDDLLSLIKITDLRYHYLLYPRSNNNLEFTVLLREVWDIQNILNYELKFHYPHGLPDPQLIWSYYPPTNTYRPIYPQFYLDLLTDAVYSDLVQNHTPLTDRTTIIGKGYQALVYQISVDEDNNPEWLLMISWEALDGNTWLILNEGPGFSYTKLQPGLPNLDWSEFDSYSIETLQDFTGDGLTDVIYLASNYGMGTQYGTFYIAQGFPGGFKLIGQVSHLIYHLSESPLYKPLYKIDTPPGSRWLSLTLKDTNHLNWDCGWDTLTTYRWPYGQQQVEVSGKEPPQTPDCYLAHAVELRDPPDNLNAIKLIENAMAHFNPADPVQNAKIAFSHYRLAVLYALEGMELPARQHLEVFIDSYTQSPAFLHDQLLPLLDGKPVNPITLCYVLSGADFNDIPEIWRKYANVSGGLYAYPDRGDFFPPVICPLRDILSNLLDRVHFNPVESPNKALSSVGIPVYSVHSYPVKNQAYPAWFVLFDTQPYYLAAYIPGQAGWDWHLIHEFNPSIGSPQVFNEDVTHDGIPELAFALQSQYNYGCSDTEHSFVIFLSTSFGNGYITMTYPACSPNDKPYDFRTFLADRDGDGLVDLVLERIKDSTANSFYYVNGIMPNTWFTQQELNTFLFSQSESQSNLIQQLYESKQPAKIRKELLTERDSLSTQDPFWSRKWQQLTYLIAVSYELEGQAEKAVQAFIQVIQAETHTLWGNLAAMHLK